MSTSNSKHSSFLYIINENIHPKGRAPIQLYKVVPRKDGISDLEWLWLLVWL